MGTQVQAIHETEGVAPLRGYRNVYFYELDELCALCARPLADDLRSAAAAHAATPAVKTSGGFCFKFWPAPSQAGQLADALAVVRRSR